MDIHVSVLITKFKVQSVITITGQTSNLPALVSIYLKNSTNLEKVGVEIVEGAFTHMSGIFHRL